MAQPKKKRAKKRAARKKASRSWGERARSAVAWRPGPIGQKLIRWGGLAAFWGVFALLMLLAYYAYDLPDVDAVLAEKRPPVITVLDARGEQVGLYGEGFGEWIPREDMPQVMIDAVLAIEDRRFYSHGGVDYFGLVRAMVANIRAGGVVQGGSTLTQQLAKNLFLTPARTFKRKIQEFMLAYWLEYKLSKDEILENYLNRVYLGAGTYGIEAASRHYFDKSARELRLPDAALLAGLLKAPTRYSPLNSMEKAQNRTDIVLAAMVDAGKLSDAARQSLPPLIIIEREVNLTGRYYTDWAVRTLAEVIGPPSQDVIITTTLDLRLQTAAQRAIRARLLDEGKTRGASQAALIAMQPDGAVVAMVGGMDYSKSEYNRAIDAQRQPGSAFKLFVYLAAIEDGMTPDTVMRDSPIVLERGWRPSNYGGGYDGKMTLYEAFARSTNTIAVKLGEASNRPTVIKTAERLGISSEIYPGPALALGASEVNLLELTGAYASVAANGLGVLPYAITEVRTRDGEVLYRRRGSGLGRVIERRHVNYMRQLLAAPLQHQRGTGRAAKLSGVSVYGKTGTSQDSRDAWFMGFTDKMVTGVWVGNDDNSPMKVRGQRAITGGATPARIWKDFMAEVHK